VRATSGALRRPPNPSPASPRFYANWGLRLAAQVRAVTSPRDRRRRARPVGRRPLPRPQRRLTAAPGPTAPRHRRHRWAPTRPATPTSARSTSFSSRQQDVKRGTLTHACFCDHWGLCRAAESDESRLQASVLPTPLARRASTAAGRITPPLSAAQAQPWIRARRSSPVPRECCVGWRHEAAKWTVWRTRAREGAARRALALCANGLARRQLAAPREWRRAAERVLAREGAAWQAMGASGRARSRADAAASASTRRRSGRRGGRNPNLAH
jgi:hypothetical protein